MKCAAPRGLAQGLPGFGLASKKDGRPINRAVDGLPISGSAPQQEHELAETSASSTRAGAQDEQMAMVMSTTFSTETSAGNSLAVGVLNLVADARCGGRALLYRVVSVVLLRDRASGTDSSSFALDPRL